MTEEIEENMIEEMTGVIMTGEIAGMTEEVAAVEVETEAVEEETEGVEQEEDSCCLLGACC